jgi:electron transfer flavoprotein-quinone oxidoreductase
MTAGRYEVVIIGAGAAGLAAAVGLARAGFAVAVVEAAPFPGASVPPGCVYRAEYLAAPDLFGPDGVAALPWERRVVERGLFATDGQGLLGLTYRDPDAFRHCYAVLRPDFDRRLAEVAAAHGAVLFNDTAAETLIREGERVIGISTSRGPLYTDLVFLAEGDPSYLLRREGRERPPGEPYSLGMQQIVELPPGAVEERFGVGDREGAAYEVLLRNPTLCGRSLHLNARALIITQRRGVSLSLLVPLNHLRDNFGDEPRLLVNWLLALPALKPWLQDGRRGAYSARVIRDGGRDVLPVVADGLAVGGAAAGLGVAFPFLDHIGPASASGLLLVRTAAAIRATGGGFSQANLRHHYLASLSHMVFREDQEFLRRWPEYVRTTPVFFGRDVDLALGTAHAWTRPGRGLLSRWFSWLELLWSCDLRSWREIRADARRLLYSLRWRDVLYRPSCGLLLLGGTLNALRDLTRQPRPNLPAAGTVRIYYWGAADEREGRPGPLLRRWFHRFNGVLAPALRRLWGHEPAPLAARLPAVGRLLLEQLNLLDLLIAAGLALTAATSAFVLAPWFALRRSAGGRHARYAAAARDVTDLVNVARPPEAAPALVGSKPLIRVLLPPPLAERQAVGAAGFIQVCPAGVFEVRTAPLNQPQVAVHPERCLACGACWRASDMVDWGRDGGAPGPPAPADLLNGLEAKLWEFDAALAEGPATVDRDRADYLNLLARYARQLAVRVQDQVGRGAGANGVETRHLAAELAARAEERARHAWEQHFAWAAADGRRLRQHDLPGLRRLLEPPAVGTPAEVGQGNDRVGPLAGAADIAEGMCRHAVRLALGRVHLPGLFQDEDGRDSIAKFGAVKELVADMAARRYLIETLADTPVRADLAELLTTEALGPGPGSLVDAAGQLAAIAGPPADERLAELRRAAAERRAHSSVTAAVYLQIGEVLLGGGTGDSTELLRLPGEAALVDELVQRQALTAELDEVRQMEAVLAALTVEVRAATAQPPEARAAAAEALARAAVWVVGSKALLFRTHRRLEQGSGGEVAVALLAVGLEAGRATLEACAAAVRRWLTSREQDPARPVVEPGAGPPLRSYAAYLAAPVHYESGDFLTGSVDLLQPRLAPELAGPQAPGLGGNPDSRFGHALAQVSRLREDLDEVRALASQSGCPAWAAWRLRQMEEDLFLAESLAYEVAGRRAHPGTRSLRLESAACRLLLGELRQRSGAAAAEIRALRGAGGPPDAAADNEGHAAGQRFLILKELATRVAPRWVGPAVVPRHLAREVLELEALRASFRQQVDAARELFGEGLWQNPNLQAGCFVLSDAVAWLAAADSVLHRLAWLSRRALADEEELPGLPLARRALEKCFLGVRLRLRRFDRVLARFRRGYYAPAVRAAELLFRLAGGPHSGPYAQPPP